MCRNILWIGLTLIVSGTPGATPNQLLAGDPNEKPSFAFGVLADVQYADKETAGKRSYRESLGNLEKCVAEFNRHELAFTIQLGDIIDGNSNPERTHSDLDRILAVYSKLKMPAFHVIGNHCLNAGKEKLGAALGLKSFYYDFSLPQTRGWRFVVLDGNDAGYGVLSELQLQWLRETLIQARRNDERVIIFNHFPLLKEAAKDHRMKDPVPLLTLFEESRCVVAYLAGHDHAGGSAFHQGIGHVTLKGMVEAPARNAYAIISVFPTRLVETGFGEEPSRKLLLNGLDVEGHEITQVTNVLNIIAISHDQMPAVIR
ncbi:MAG: metallophosphoesterase [Pirellulales bacterium]|nr:metallophosphoesterase [Pirellulales bacterium]